MVASTTRSRSLVITMLPSSVGWPNIARMPSRMASSQPKPVNSRPTTPMIPAMVSSAEPVRASIPTMPPVPPGGVMMVVPIPSFTESITVRCRSASLPTIRPNTVKPTASAGNSEKKAT